jgi:hypothetical protein
LGDIGRMRRALFFAANLLAGIVLMLLIVNPTRDLALMGGLLTAGVILAWVVPRFVRRE